MLEELAQGFHFPMKVHKLEVERGQKMKIHIKGHDIIYNVLGTW
jgi:hypothetical protein